ncbi:MAG TPA: hypothetical protein DIW46_01870 [Microbacterium sp.]|nr:hypothetical protein [Microbacterium sp.]
MREFSIGVASRFVMIVGGCLVLMFNTGSIIELLEPIWTLVMTQPEVAMKHGAVLTMVMSMFWSLCRLAFGPRNYAVHSRPIATGAVAARTVDPPVGPELERFARHEAAHAVAAIVLGMNAVTADIHAVGDRGGRVTYEPDEDLTVHEQSFDALVFGFAGQVADHRTAHFDQGSMGDMGLQQLRMMSIIATGQRPERHAGPLTIEALIESTRTEAELLLTQHAAAHERITEALIADRELNDQRLREMVESVNH